jgi:hypothetical protein
MALSKSIFEIILFWTLIYMFKSSEPTCDIQRYRPPNMSKREADKICKMHNKAKLNK